jgi:hypothetical protein
VMFQLPVTEVANPMQKVPAAMTELELEEGVEHPNVERMADPIVRHKEEFTGLAAHDRVKLLVAIPEASPPSHRSKRRADNADQANLEWAEKMKVAHNLDASFNQGTTDTTVYSFFALY